ncbi:hypothetical protein AMTR_s00072p00140390 [Amborella trichopoda]|uniref:Uncharacterized protein n=1 Tax=Amborella trichopoda TaxID=13333 RepID=W1NS55_AMBTC|nr:hypothetical protein AMTR_s00072p00140390 [Amborella trichopoda]
MGMPYYHTHHEMGHNEKLGFLSEDRVESHMAASTSTAFRDSMLRQRDTSQLGIRGETPWWARPHRKYSGPQNSFLEPLSFVDHGISTNTITYQRGVRMRCKMWDHLLEDRGLIHVSGHMIAFLIP